jgi:hypothetical protein
MSSMRRSAFAERYAGGERKKSERNESILTALEPLSIMQPGALAA